MGKYSVIEGKAVTTENIDEARKLDTMVYDEEYFVTLRQCLEWNKKNNRIYTMIQDNESGRIVAYVNISPVTDEYYDKIKSGKFIDTYLPPEAIVDYVLPDTYNVYFSSVVVHPDYQNSQVFLMLFNAIAEKFTKLAEEEILIKRMVADAVSDKGEKFCEMFGMTKQKNSNHDSEIYEVYMLPPSFRVSSRATRELYKVYKRISDELGFTENEEMKKATHDIRTPQAIAEDAQRVSDNTDRRVDEKVFISYATSEKETAETICKYLESNGVPCWIAPRNVVPGGNYASQIVGAIRQSAALVLVASESTNASGHVSNEVSIAFDSKKAIIPFKIENFTFSDEYLYFLGRKNWIEAHQNMQAGLEKLLRTLKPVFSDQKPKEEKQIKQLNPEIEKERISPEPTLIKKDTMTKENMVRIILEKASKYSTKQICRFEDEDRFEELRPVANSFLSQVFAIYRYNKPIAVHQPIDYLVEELLSDDDAEVIRVSGMPGSGKTLLMQAAFYKTIKKYSTGETPYLPFYLALSYFEEKKYQGGITAEKVRSALEDELKEFLQYIKTHKETIPVLFVDEVREHTVGKINIENLLLEIIKDDSIYKRVVAIDCGLVKDKAKIKRVIPIISERISARFEASPIDAHDRRKATSFISNVARYFDCEIDEKEVFELLKKQKYQEIDVFLARSFSEEVFYGQDPISNRGDLYEKWALSELKGDEEQLRKAAELAYSYLFRVETRTESISNPQWKLIHLHQSFLNMLIAFHLVKQLEASDESNSEANSIFDVMLTSSSYVFLRAFLKDNYVLQEKLLLIVKNNLAGLSYEKKSCAVSWLASLTNKNLIAEATLLLKPVYEENKPVVKKSDNTTQQNYDLQMYYRSACLTLIKYGNTNILDDYLCLLIINDSANAINRGATVEYYDEPYEMHANGNCYLDSDIKKGNKTIKALLWKVGRLLSTSGGSYPERDLITLCMLLQRRIQSNEAKKVKELNDWVSETLAAIKKYQMRPQHIKSEKIEYYFSSVQDDFTDYLNNSEGFDISQKLYNTLRKLRDIKRKQWVEKSIEDPESVSEHLYSVWMMAMLFLPEDLGYEGYSKREILDMLLIHDMAEAKLGDQVLGLNEPKKDLREQNDVMRKLMVKGTYPNVASLTYYYNVWTGYYNGININSKIARDFNLIQSVYTFCEYYAKYPEHFSPMDKDLWMGEKSKLETEIGYAVYEKLVENNSDFEALFRER